MKKDVMIPVQELLKKWRKDPEYVKAYEALKPEFEIYEAMIQAMKKSGLAQSELAERMKTTKSSVSRTLSGKYPPSWNTILRFASATGAQPKLTFVSPS